jgi:FkbM family methyltransferase
MGSMASAWERTTYLTSYLFSHPAFRHAPFRVMWRAVRWEFIKLSGKPVEIPIHSGATMRLYPPKHRYGHTGLVYLFRELNESLVLHAIDQYAIPGSTVLDIGTNVGLWTTRMSLAVGPNGRVHSFEPVPPTADQLRENIALSHADNVVVHQVGLSDEVGTATIHVPVGAAGRASLAAESDSCTQYEIALVRFDDVWSELGEPDVSFVKVDIEGSEVQFFEGARRFFTAQKPVVTCEVLNAKLRRMGHTRDELFGFFSALGYSWYRWSDSEECYLPDSTTDQGNVLFVPAGRPDPEPRASGAGAMRASSGSEPRS